MRRWLAYQYSIVQIGLMVYDSFDMTTLPTVMHIPYDWMVNRAKIERFVRCCISRLRRSTEYSSNWATAQQHSTNSVSKHELALSSTFSPVKEIRWIETAPWAVIQRLISSVLTVIWRTLLEELSLIWCTWYPWLSPDLNAFPVAKARNTDIVDIWNIGKAPNGITKGKLQKRGSAC